MRHESGVSLIATVVLVTACSSPVDGPGQLRPGPLEDVPFDAIGSGKLLFDRSISTAALYLVDGTDQTSRLAFSDASIRGAVISPNGQRVAFTRPVATLSYDLFVVGIDGGAETQLMQTTDVYEGMPTWAPDGAKIVYHIGQPGFSSYVLRSPVANATDAADVVRFDFQSGVIIVCPYGEFSIPAALSSRGELAFPCREGIYQTTPVKVTNRLHAAPEGSFVHAPAWSGDGFQLAFVERTSSTLMVKVLRDDASTVTTLATLPTVPVNWSLFNIYSLCWSADGSRLFFSVPESANVAHIWSVRSDGSALRQITTNATAFDHNVSCSG